MRRRFHLGGCRLYMWSLPCPHLQPPCDKEFACTYLSPSVCCSDLRPTLQFPSGAQYALGQPGQPQPLHPRRPHFLVHEEGCTWVVPLPFLVPGAAVDQLSLGSALCAPRLSSRLCSGLLSTSFPVPLTTQLSHVHSLFSTVTLPPSEGLADRAPEPTVPAVASHPPRRPTGVGPLKSYLLVCFPRARPRIP